MRELAYFHLCRALGWLLQTARYSSARLVCRNGERSVRKNRSFYAPLLVPLGNALLRVLDTGVRVLPDRDWHERESQIYRNLYGSSVRADADGTLILPCLAGETLAALLEEPALGRRRPDGRWEFRPALAELLARARWKEEDRLTPWRVATEWAYAQRLHPDWTFEALAPGIAEERLDRLEARLMKLGVGARRVLLAAGTAGLAELARRRRLDAWMIADPWVG